MPNNPGRGTDGGDVDGVEKTDQTNALGKPLEVARASYDPGYDIDETLEAGYVSKADLKRGYATYGQAIGEGRKDWREAR